MSEYVKNELIVETKKFREELSKASSDCYLKSNDERDNTRIYAITLDRIIEIAFEHIIETYGSWNSIDPEVVLRKKLYSKGFKKIPRYKNEKELYQKICDFDNYNAISVAEKKVFDALSKLSSEYRWNLYLALSGFIDHFLW